MVKKLPYLLSVLGMLGGVLIAILFGADEEIFKKRIQDGLAKNEKVQAIQDPAKKAETLKSEEEKNWRYYQRYHFHANGVSSMALALLVLLAFVQTSTKQKLLVSYLLSIGGFLYPFVWLFAALYGPEMGRGAAKEHFAYLGYMGGVFLVGVMWSLYLVLTKPLKTPLAE